MVTAQLIKIPLQYVTNRSWNFRIAFSTGGMPSSHSAAVVSLTTAIGMKDGVSSTAFAVAAVLSAITMFDAAGVRRHAGQHAAFLNRMIQMIPGLLGDAASRETVKKRGRQDFKELLGHQPLEVFAGGVFGAVVAVVIHYLFYS